MGYDVLFSPMKIGTMTVKNRIVMAAAEVSMAQTDGKPTEKLMDYYETRAKGGVGLIIPGITRVNDMGGASTFTQLSMSHDYNIEPMREFVRRIHSHGTKICIQLHHAGRQGYSSAINTLPLVIPIVKTFPKVLDKIYASTPTLLGLEAKGICMSVQSPSKCELAVHGAMRMHAMSKREVKKLINDFVDAAVRCKMASVDGVELHAGHGYLIQQFLSPNTNHRMDEYGGSFENRMRFITEIIEGIRKKCGKDFPIIVRLTVDEMYDRIGKKGKGYDLETGKLIAKRLEELGVDAINVTSACYEVFNGWLEPTTYEPGWRKYLAKEIKSVVNIPVIAANVIRTPEQAEKQLEEGCQDFVASARTFFCDPDWAKKAKENRPEDIRRCIGCLHCMKTFMNNATLGKPTECALNMGFGKEKEYENMPVNGDERKIVVVGAGPAGLTAAVTLAKRNFDVRVYDKNEKAGGQVITAAECNLRDKLYWCIEDLMTQAKKEGVKFEFGKEICVDDIKQIDPYAVILATGGVPLVPKSIPGTDRENVCTADEIILKKKEISEKKVVVVGSGMTGLETAELLGEKGNKVTVIEMADEIASGAWFQLVDDELERLKSQGTEILLGTKLVAIEEGRVICEDTKSGEKKNIETDLVVLSLGVRPTPGLADEIKKIETIKSYRVGDALSSGTIADACHSAFEIAMTINQNQVSEGRENMIENKNIVLTGGSSGIGKSILEKLAKGNGNKIIVACRSAASISGFGENVIPFTCDLSTKEGVDKLFEKINAEFDTADIFISNAGAPYYEKVNYVDWDRIEHIYQLNTISHIYIYQKYLEYLNGRAGHLCYTISAMGEMALPGYALYASSKFAMKGFQQAIRREGVKNLKLTCIYPVSTNTNFFNVGGNGIEMEKPFPVQEPEKVADKTIKGIAKEKKNVYPCGIYVFSKVLMTIIPPIRNIYLSMEQKRLERFIARAEQAKKNG